MNCPIKKYIIFLLNCKKQYPSLPHLFPPITDGCIPAQLKVVSYNITSVTLSWIIPNDRNNTHLSFASLFSSGKEIQNYTTMYKEQTITGLSPFTEYNVSISSLCNGTESIPSWLNIETGIYMCKTHVHHIDVDAKFV